MKKFFYLALAVVAGSAMLVSCNGKKNDNPTSSRCWEITSKVTVGGHSATVNSYVWGTEADVKAAIKEAEEEAKKEEADVTFSYSKADANDEAACKAKNPYNPGDDANTYYCWKVTQKISATQTTTYYTWMTETEAAAQKMILGDNATMEKSDAADLDACNKLNEDVPDQPKPEDYDKYDNTKLKCWMVTMTAYGTDMVNYLWATERAVVMEMDASARMGGFTYTYKESDAKDEESCEELGSSEEEACWKITSTVMGQTEVNYTWGRESEVKVEVNAINASGYGVASYEKTSIDDPDACYEME